jgi:O-antigen biosynthesis protein
MNVKDATHALSHVPWALDGRRQDFDQLCQSIITENGRYMDLVDAPAFSLITPMWNTSPMHLEELIWSCLAQSYPKWQLILYDDGSQRKEHLDVAKKYAQIDLRVELHLCELNRGISGARNQAITFAKGDFIAILDHDDLIHPQLLGVLYERLKLNPKINFIFTNEAKISDDSKQISDFFSKPSFDKQTLLRTNYICHFTAIHKSIYSEVMQKSGFIFDPSYDGVEDHEFFLRCALQTELNTEHVPLFGYFWRINPSSTAGSLSNKPWVVELGQRMVLEKARLLYQNPNLDINSAGSEPGRRLYSIVFTEAIDPKAVVLVIVPFKDHAELTLKCLDSLELQIVVSPLQVVLVDNGSVTLERESVNAWLKGPKKHSYQVMDFSETFNFGKINNLAVEGFGKSFDYVLFLNNDVELLNPSTVFSMLNVLHVEPKIAHCSIRLNFPDTQILEYGGIEFHPTLIGSGYFYVRHLDDSSDFSFDEHVVLLSGFACCMIKRDAWTEVGPINEDLFANGFSDIEWCLRATKYDFKGFYLGSVVGTHHQSKTRKANSEDHILAYLHLHYGSEIQKVRLETMSYNKFVGLNMGNLGNTLSFPLRYRLVDKMNSWLKVLMGPAHRVLKRFLLMSKKV